MVRGEGSREQQYRDSCCRGRRLLRQGNLPAKALSVAAKSLSFISVELHVDVHYDGGIRKAIAPAVAVESVRYVSVEVGAHYDRGTFHQRELSG